MSFVQYCKGPLCWEKAIICCQIQEVAIIERRFRVGYVNRSLVLPGHEVLFDSDPTSHTIRISEAGLVGATRIYATRQVLTC
jgi:hypothetical protein